MEQLRIKATSPAQVVRSLSGGNQQKVVLAKWLAAEPRILILDEPTRGVDVGTKADVHRTISHLATQGLTILLISSELPEVLGMSDRVLVMREGRLVAELSRAEATQERVIQAAAGVGGRRVIARVRAMKPQELAAAAFRLREIGIVIALSRSWLCSSASRADNFLTASNWQDIAQNVSIVVVVAVGETMVVLTRNIDLSVGSIVGLSAYLTAATLDHHHGIPVEVVALIAIAIGLGLGLVNGLLVAVARIPSIIATLATLAIYRGIDAEITGGQNITAYQFPTASSTLAASKPAGFPALAWIALGVTLVGAATSPLGSVGERLLCDRLEPGRCPLRRHPDGRRVITAFAHLRRARGPWRLPVRRPLPDPRLQSPRHGFELDVITAVVIGGVNVFGGSGTILGVVLGAVLVATISDGFTLLRLDEFWKIFFNGLRSSRR